MGISKTLQMRFVNQAGRRVTISLTAPKEALTEAEVSAAMDEIIAKNIFTTSGGDLVSKYSAEIVERSVNTLYEA